jgi:hypothetical protein
MKRLAFLLLTLLTACAHGGRFIPEPAHAGDRNAKAVRAIVPFASELAWRRSPYWRLEDFGWPWDVIVANDNTVCALFKQVIYLPSTNDYFVCPTAWRQARPRP